MSVEQWDKTTLQTSGRLAMPRMIGQLVLTANLAALASLGSCAAPKGDHRPAQPDNPPPLVEVTKNSETPYGLDTCRDDTDCAIGEHCAAAKCVTECRKDSDCDPGRRCAPRNGRCVDDPRQKGLDGPPVAWPEEPALRVPGGGVYEVESIGKLKIYTYFYDVSRNTIMQNLHSLLEADGWRCLDTGTSKDRAGERIPQLSCKKGCKRVSIMVGAPRSDRCAVMLNERSLGACASAP